MKSFSVLFGCLLILFSTLPCRSIAQSPQAEVKAPVRLYFDEVVNKQNINLIKEIFSQDYVFHEMNGKDSQHMKNNTLVPHLNYLFKAFPDLH